MRDTIRRAALVAASTGLVAAGAAAVTATPAQAAAPVCSVHVVSLYAYDLTDNDGTDEVKIKLGDSRWAGPWDMTDNKLRKKFPGLDDKDFSRSLVVRLAEQDATRHEIGRHTLKCTADVGEQTLRFKDDKGLYDMKVEVTED
jgi:hypothetical protein